MRYRKSSNVETIYFKGYSIIQLPDFLLILYKKLSNINWFEHAHNSTTTKVNVNVAPLNAVKSCTPNLDQLESETNSTNSRLCRLEEDNINIFRKLDEMLVTINSKS